MKAKKKPIIHSAGLGLLAMLILLFSGCSGAKKAADPDSWQNEVLLAEECGFDGLKCCADPENSCKYGQSCCANPADPKDNYCAESCDLGAKHSFCRQSEPACDEGLACRDSRCLPCGGEDEWCCAGQDACRNELVCFSEKCHSCGQENGPCCAEAPFCAKEDDRGRIRTECQTGVCRACGYGGVPSCQSEPLCNPENLFNNNLCYACGRENQPCCDKGACGEGLECKVGFCSK